MLGDYVLHFPLTDFAVSLLAIAALIEVARVVLKRPAWAVAVDVLLVSGFLGALAAVGSGLWLVSTELHVHDDLLSIHHRFAYGTLATASASMIARLLQKRSPVLGAIKTVTLLVSALLVSGAGFYGGKMAHPPVGTPSHDAVPHDDALPHSDTMPADRGMSPGHGALPSPYAPGATLPRLPDAAESKPATTPKDHDSTPHEH